jgi:alkanesulfonate monooxygenase SsuD/methylene tetrahydromethanopterin reductase-like flavin-dependent oxidoreductase (luciferase family)
LEVFAFVPQMRMTVDAIVDRARVAEAAGFDGIAVMDHLAPPMAPSQPAFEAMATSAWLLASTTRVKVGALVLCDAFRHPAVLAQAAVTLDHASGGRFELGIGAGSVADELEAFGVEPSAVGDRVDRLEETLQVLERLWSGTTVDFDGAHHRLRRARQALTPITKVPVVIGGTGPRMLGLARRHATWWNLPVNALDRFDELHPRVGDARPSVQLLIGLAPDEAAARRYPGLPMIVGTPDELVDHLGGWADRGAERAYLWFTDFAPPATLDAFGDVLAGVRREDGTR